MILVKKTVRMLVFSVVCLSEFSHPCLLPCFSLEQFHTEKYDFSCKERCSKKQQRTLWGHLKEREREWTGRSAGSSISVTAIVMLMRRMKAFALGPWQRHTVLLFVPQSNIKTEQLTKKKTPPHPGICLRKPNIQTSFTSDTLTNAQSEKLKSLWKFMIFSQKK